MQTSKRKLAQIKGLSEAKCEKIYEAGEKIAPISAWQSGKFLLEHRQANLFRLRERREDRLLALDADVRHRGHAALEARFERVHERHRRVLRPGDEVGLHELAVAPPERVRERRVRSRGAVLAQAARGEGVGVAELRRVLGVGSTGLLATRSTLDTRIALANERASYTRVVTLARLTSSRARHQ